MPKKKTHEEFINEIYELVGNEYTVLGRYEKNMTKILIKHNLCNNEYMVTPNDFLQGHRCPKCKAIKASKRLNKTHEKFLEEVYDLVGDEYTVLGEYEKNNKKIKIRHNKCQYIFEMTPVSFLKGYRCKECSKIIKHNKLSKSHEEFIKEVKEKVGDEYTVLGEYINNKTKILMKHNLCNNEYLVAPNYFLSSNCRCPKCAIINLGLKKRKSNEEFINEIKEKVGDEYTVLGRYVNNKTKILMKHNLCNNEYMVTPVDFLSGYRCSYCKKSKGEEKIFKYLDKLKINYKREVSFPDCKYKFPLRFDFQIITNNDNIILIEYDGEQHFKPTFYGDNFETQQLRDKIKDEYCNNNPNIHLYRIKYTEFDNIESILDNILKEEFK